jgi:hypothetical protein
MSITDTFDPDRNGWIFENWGESSEFSWDLFRRTYIGINPTQDCIAAPLDCAFYEIFKNCAAGGNCGGLSLLALAMFKHGGWMGFCGPANFYSGVNQPDRTDLYEAINIFQARQFSASGIENFIDVVDSGNLNNAITAYNTISSHLGSGDYCVLSIANDAIGDEAHTVIPYATYQSGGTRYIYVWDPNTPYDDYGSVHYDAGLNRVVINGATNWQYVQRDGASSGTKTYIGHPTGWCFAVPMSKVLRKARHPLALDMVLDGLMALFVSGPGAVAQVEDEEGRRLYTTDASIHTSRGDLESDPSRRLTGVARWPWYANNDGGPPGELYFLRGPTIHRNLKITLAGRQPRLMYVGANSLIEMEASKPANSRDVIELAGVGTANQGIRLRSSTPLRNFDINQVHKSGGTQGWRGVKLDGLRPAKAGLDLRATGFLRAVDIVSHGSNQDVKASLSQLDAGTLTSDEVQDLRISKTRPARVMAPWLIPR